MGESKVWAEKLFKGESYYFARNYFLHSRCCNSLAHSIVCLLTNECWNNVKLLITILAKEGKQQKSTPKTSRPSSDPRDNNWDVVGASLPVHQTFVQRKRKKKRTKKSRKKKKKKKLLAFFSFLFFLFFF